MSSSRQAKGAVVPGGQALIAPEGFKLRRYQACVETVQKYMDEYRAISLRANREALPLLYKTGLAIRKLFTEESHYQHINKLAGDCGIETQYAYNAFAIVKTWSPGEFSKLVERGLTYSHIKRLLAVRSKGDRSDLVKQIVTESMTVAKLEDTIKKRAKANPDFVSKKSRATRDSHNSRQRKASALKVFPSKVESFKDLASDLTVELMELVKSNEMDNATGKLVSEVKEELQQLEKTVKSLSELVAKL